MVNRLVMKTVYLFFVRVKTRFPEGPAAIAGRSDRGASKGRFDAAGVGSEGSGKPSVGLAGCFDASLGPELPEL